ncbi:MAG: hypothetical protein Ct9H300mP14_15730 [Gammaproteobacteria bacterium]|nr:MAG: hypothetical protein Ct9H300mP14_15730 [Gammaproteobacteria bacterium]
MSMQKHRLVSTLGVDDLVIVDTPDALLVSARENVERVKQVVARLKEKDRPQYVTHRKVFRPWGSYDSLENGPGFQVKRFDGVARSSFIVTKAPAPVRALGRGQWYSTGHLW